MLHEGARPDRSGSASGLLLPVFAGLRSAIGGTLAGAFLLLALGAPAALPALAQTDADFVIYHDANASAAATERYDAAIGLLDGSGRSYTVRDVTGTDRVNRLAGVSNSVLPRFFLGDPDRRSGSNGSGAAAFLLPAAPGH